jgi:hypothetical protein
MRCGLPKRSWPTQEIAETIRLRQNDPLLVVYECPAQPGFWHLGHRKNCALPAKMKVEAVSMKVRNVKMKVD